jgi:hypothetical protein
VYTGDQDDAERILFFCTDPPLNEIGIRFEPDDDGIYQMTLGGGVEEYAFERLE